VADVPKTPPPITKPWSLDEVPNPLSIVSLLVIEGALMITFPPTVAIATPAPPDVPEEEPLQPVNTIAPFVEDILVKAAPNEFMVNPWDGLPPLLIPPIPVIVIVPFVVETVAVEVFENQSIP
jgi:hypothetical protein